MLPATIVLLPVLPLTERGKIDRAGAARPRARSADGQRRRGHGARGRPLMADLLGLDRLGAEEDFFELGADSLLAIQLVGRLRDRFGVGVDGRRRLRAPPARRLAWRLERRRRPSGPTAVDPRRRAAGPAPATFAQRRAWLFERMNPDSLSFQFAAMLHLDGSLDEDALRGALADLMRAPRVLPDLDRGARRRARPDRPRGAAGCRLEIVDLRGERA